jgi:large subunit ribosomal protein L6
MSRIGKQPVLIPSGTTVTIGGDGATVSVKGPRGELSRTLPKVSVALDDNQAVVTPLGSSREHRSCHGLSRALLANMVKGVSEGHNKTLLIAGTGYKANASGQKLTLNLGYSHPVEYVLPEGVSVTVEERGTSIRLECSDKEVLGQVAANIRGYRPPEPYKGKGIRYSDEYVRRKAGKAGVAAGA